MHSLFSLLILLATSISALAGRNAGDALLEHFPETVPPGLATMAPKPVNWAQPPLGCVEEMIPHLSNRACPDLTKVENPNKDWPANISPEEKSYWFGQRRGISACRALEVMRREAANPGSMNPSWVQVAWMTKLSLNRYEDKVTAVYEASRRYGVPLHVLMGAVFQESLFSELGIYDDGGNYSCGVEQINLIGWCAWANEQSAADKKAMNWPANPVSCSDANLVKLSLFKPLYTIALSRLRGLPEYRLQKEHFANIPLASVVKQWPAATPEVQALRYQLIMSFVNNCSDARKGILAKGHELSGIYKQFISSALKAKDRYTRGDHFQRDCREVQKDNAYPLHTGWLLTVASYNAGPRAIDAAAHYNRWDRDAMNDPRQVASYMPTDIVTSLYWGGRYNPSNDLIEFTGLNGAARNWTWFKGCVAQRHVARVMQHVTLLPEFFVDSLENGIPCARSTFDSDGNLIKSAVPAFRQTSSGVR